MNWLFSNRYRLQKLLIGILLLLGLCAHTHIAGNQYTHQKLIVLEHCLTNPTSCVDKPLVMRVKVKQSSNRSFIAHPRIRGEFQLAYPIPLVGDLTGVESGYVISILGTYSSDRTFIVSKFEKDNWVRIAKYSISLLGLVLTIMLMSRRYRFSSDRPFPLVHR